MQTPLNSSLAASVIVPTYARPGRVTRCLEAIAAMDAPAGGFETIVVDDGSPTPPDAEVGAFKDRLDVRIYRQANAGPGAARNLGARHARGKLFAFTADDCRPAKDWLAQLVKASQARPGALLGGRVVHDLPANPYATSSHLLIDFLYSRYNADPERARFFTPNNMAVPADRYREIGGFDPTTGGTGEDRELCGRWLDKGWPMAFVPEAEVLHAHPLTLRSFAKQQFAYGVGSAKHRKRLAARGGAIRQGTPEPLGFYAKLVFHPLRYGKRPRDWYHVGLMVLGQAANAIGVIRESRFGPPVPADAPAARINVGAA